MNSQQEALREPFPDLCPDCGSEGHCKPGCPSMIGETMSDAMTPAPKDSPLMLAWTAYKASPGYANTRKWALDPEHVDGSLWAAFESGFRALLSAPPQPEVGVREAIHYRGSGSDLAEDVMKVLNPVELKRFMDAMDLSAPAAQEPVARPIRHGHIQDFTDEYADDIGVERFAAVMLAKLAKKRGEGRGGWNRADECDVDVLREYLAEHVEKGDPIDIANFCMMIWNRENPTAHPASAADTGRVPSFGVTEIRELIERVPEAKRTPTEQMILDELEMVDEGNQGSAQPE